MTPRILFMGTPDIAVTCLDALVRAGMNVVGAVTRTDKPRGRHAILTPPPVKVYAEEHGIDVLVLSGNARLPPILRRCIPMLSSLSPSA